MKMKLALYGLLLNSLLYAESVEESLEGFDDTPTSSVQVEQSNDNVMDGFDESNSSEIKEEKVSFLPGLTGKLTEQLTYSYNGTTPHDKFTSLKSSFFLDYEHKLDLGWKFKINAKAYYDAIYDIRDDTYSRNELDELRGEVELFDAYLEGSLSDNLDLKLGRQVVVWGRSDTIRITDVLNPLDNRRPGMVDIEDLRLPVTMAKFDYFIDNWRITPIVIFEQRFSKNPPFGSAFYPSPLAAPDDKHYTDVTYALSVGGEFSAWDINFYFANMHNDAGYIPMKPNSKMEHDKVNMFGTALNFLSGSWLFKTELAYFDGLKFTSTQEEKFSRTDALIGVEYKGIADAMFSYDLSIRHLNSYDIRLLSEFNPLERNTYQHAFRMTYDFMNDTLHANYLISLYGSKLDKGGYQRAWIKYDIADAISTNIGAVDYIKGSKLLDAVKDNDMMFMDVSYSF
jgi:hypothetical protein